MKKVCIVNYNTTVLTQACIKSLRRHGGEDYHVIVFDNSDRKPFPPMEGVAIIDNTNGQLIDFDAELAKYPKKNVGIGCAVGCNFGSVKHMMSVDWLLWNTKEPFVLLDSDVLIRENIDEYFDETQATIGKIHVNNPLNVPRLEPMLCWLNAPMLREAGIHYFDADRSWGLKDSRDDRTNWYDTGASLLEDVKNADMPWRERDTYERHIYHKGSGSWKTADTTDEWMEEHRDLWDDTPFERGIERVAMCAIVRLENDYLPEWVEWHKKLGVSHFFIYDNSRPGDARPAEVLQRHIEQGTVEIVNWPFHTEHDNQCPAYEDCYKKHGREYAWIGFLDIDEEVVLLKHKTIPELLNLYSSTADVVVMQWMMMSDSGLVNYDPRPLHERFTKPAPWRAPEFLHVKSWVRGGLPPVAFSTDPHVPHEPTLRVVTPNGQPHAQHSISTEEEKSVAYIAHYYTKTAEEYVRKNLRGYPNPTWWTEKRLAGAANYFFVFNERTPEKVKILMQFNEHLPYNIRIMEHITKQSARWGYTRLIADDGYLLRSKESGQVYQEITVPNPDKFEVIPLPTSATAKPAKKGRKKAE